MQKKISGLQVFAVIVSVMVVAAVVVGIQQAGSPSTQRAKTLDQRRADALSQIVSAVEAYYGYTFTLPTSLDALAADSRTSYAVTSIKDPETGAAFEYRAIDAATFELCTTFAYPSDATDGSGGPVARPMMPAPMPGSSMTWYPHAAGHVCQQENVTEHAPFQYCGIGVGQSGCAGGNRCLQLPGRSGGICVPPGKECVAAGCGDAKCSLDKSNPQQVTCDAPAVVPAPLAPVPGMMPVKGSQQ